MIIIIIINMNLFVKKYLLLLLLLQHLIWQMYIISICIIIYSYFLHLLHF